MEIWRNIVRRKGRSMLTIGGIFIGILTLTVLGAMAEKVNALITGSEEFFASQILVSPRGGRGGNMGLNLYLTAEQIEQVATYPGVAHAAPIVNLLIQDNDHHFTFGIPPMVQGLELGTEANPWLHLPLQAGSLLNPEERGYVVLGADLASNYGVGVGDKLSLNRQEFEVKGVVQKTMAGLDNMALVSLADSREMLLAFQPQLRQLQEIASAFQSLSMLGIPGFNIPDEYRDVFDLDLDSLATSVAVYWESDIDPQVLANQLQAELGELFVLSPNEMRTMLRQAMLVINVIIMGAAGVALVVGGLSIVNTMLMAVSERTREIGIKMAVGARTSQIIREYLAEAAVMGLIGGGLGVVGGIILVEVINRYTISLGVEVFQVTSRLVVLGVSFAVLLGMLAGVYPAWRGASLQCVEALREE